MSLHHTKPQQSIQWMPHDTSRRRHLSLTACLIVATSVYGSPSPHDNSWAALCCIKVQVHTRTASSESPTCISECHKTCGGAKIMLQGKRYVLGYSSLHWTEILPHFVWLKISQNIVECFSISESTRVYFLKFATQQIKLIGLVHRFFISIKYKRKWTILKCLEGSFPFVLVLCLSVSEKMYIITTPLLI